MKNGASFVFGKQKGASESDKPVLDEILKNMARIIAETTGVDHSENEGAGAAGGLGFAVAYQGVLVTLITLASYIIGRFYLADLHHAEAIAAGQYSAEMLGTSMAFLTLSLCEICHAFNMRSLHGSIFKMKNQNWWLWGAGLHSLILTTAVVEIDFLANAFELAHLDLMEYGIAFGLAILIIPMVEIVKIVHRAIDKKKNA